MENKKLQRIIIAVAIVFVLVSIFFMFGSSLFTINNSSSSNMPEADDVSDEIVKDITIEQTFENKVDEINNIAVVFTKHNREARGKLVFELLEGNNVLYKKTMDLKDIPEQHRVFYTLEKPLTGMANKKLTLRFTSTAKSNEGVSLMINTKANSQIKVAKKTVKGTICFSINDKK